MFDRYFCSRNFLFMTSKLILGLTTKITTRYLQLKRERHRMPSHFGLVLRIQIVS